MPDTKTDEAGALILPRMLYAEESDGTKHLVLVDSDGKLIISGLSSVTNMNNEKWGNTALTGRDISTDLQVLTDLKKGAVNADALAAETANVLKAAGFGYLFNGTSWDRQRNNLEEITLLASAERTSSTVTPTQTNYNARGVMLVLDVSAITDTPSIQAVVQVIDTLSGDYEAILRGGNVTTVSLNSYVVYPGGISTAGGGDVVMVAILPLPRKWRVTVSHSDADPITYSLSAHYIL